MIEVQTAARLHLGLLDNNGELGRLYGSIGLAVDRPKILLRASPCDGLRVEGPERERVALYARRFIGAFGFPRGARLELISAIPAHVGLGSGTQLALAVGSALARLARRRLPARLIALAVGRGWHSGVGITTFQYGGFVLDGGRRIASGRAGARRLDRSGIPPVLFRQPMPKSWYFVLAIPETDPGLSGKREADAFTRLPAAPPALVGAISRVLLIQMLPALVERDAAEFGRALTRIQCMVGDCFASVQGGRFASPAARDMVDCMLASGAAGIGQSSWGPAVYGLVEGRAGARRLFETARSRLDALGGGRVLLVRPRNCGARIREPDGPGRVSPGPGGAQGAV